MPSQPGEPAPADQGPVDEAPVDEVPADQIPADQVPADHIPADAVLVDTVLLGPDDPSPPGDRVRGRELRARALDWGLGAGAVLLLLAFSVAALWFSLGGPAQQGADVLPDPTGTVGAEPTDQPTGELQPPAGLTQEQVWFAHVELDSGSLVAGGTPLLDVEGEGRDVTSGEDGLTASWVRLTGTVPYDVVAAELGEGTTVGPGGEDEARVERSVELLGRSFDVVATGTVTVEGGRLVMVPTSVELEGGGFLSNILTGLARTFVTIRHEIEGLPDGLELQQVDIVERGFRATLEGEDVRLTQ